MRNEYGNLEVIVGPMFASKTERLVEKALFLNHMRKNPLVFKPSHDTRYDQKAVVSHSGARIEAQPIAAWPGDPPANVGAVLLDEVQFFLPPLFNGDIVEIIRGLRRKGVDVYAAGLDMDWRGVAFEVTAALMAESTTITRVTARCKRCGGAATMTGRLTAGEGRYDVGGAESYAPFCNSHWFEGLDRSGGNEEAA